MIVSDAHRYVFIELPRTGSSAVANELRELYAGERVLQKHSGIQDFLAVARPEQRDYFVFTAIRDPLDDAVSDYFKYLTDHRGRYSRPRDLLPGRWQPLALAQRWLWRRVTRGEMDFTAFFRSTHLLPYDTMASGDRASYDYVMRFERLAADFEEVLGRLGIEPIRPLPVRNATGGRPRDYAAFYTPQAVARAKWVFGPYMARWGYAFPDAWGDVRLSRWSLIQYRLVGLLRAAYWRHLRFRMRGDRA